MPYARWASKEEILNHTTRLNKEDEVKKSGVTFMYDDKNLYINDSEAHALVIGGTGSGKTQTTIMPQLYLSIKAGESFITNDHGGELFEQFSGLAKENGYKVQVINFRDMTKGNNYNPLYVPYTLYKKGNVDDAIELVENVGYNLLSDFQKTDADPFWEQSSINLFTGLALYLFNKAKIEEININSIVNLCYKLDDIKNDIQDKSSIVYTYLSPIIDAPTETKGSIISVFKQKIAIITSRDAITKLLCNNNIDLDNIKEEKTALFVIGDGKYSSIIMPMILSQVYCLTRLKEPNERRLNIILDEFGLIKPIKNFIDILTHSRPLRIKLTLVVQSILHLENVYGSRTTDFIRMQIAITIFLLATDIHTLEVISKECGRIDENTPLINVEELKVLEPFEAIILANRMYPIKTKLLPYYQMGIDSVPPLELKPLEYNEVKLYK